MGNRALLVLENANNDVFPTIYLHWNGGPESVYAFLDYAKSKCRPNDAAYSTARLVQIIGNFFGSNLSLGLSALAKKEYGDDESLDPGDNGIYVVGPDLSVIGRYIGSRELSPEEVSAEANRARRDNTRMLACIGEKNNVFFDEE